jgi:hypothetical protein
MKDNFQRRVHAAAVAGWWTLLIAVLFLAAVWFVFLRLMSARPVWFQSLWSPAMTWETVQSFTLWMVSVLKLCIWLAFLIVVWLSLWARKLGKQQAGQ